MKNKLTFLFASLLLTLASCNEIIDRNLQNDILRVNYPADSFVSSNYTVPFSWEKIDGVGGYHLQIVSTSFANPQKIIVDSVITGLKFSITLYPGVYEWRIFAENGTTRSIVTTRYLKVDSNIDLTGQQFSVVFPLDDYVTRSTTISFSWNEFPYADKYEIQICDSNNIPVKTHISTALFYNDTLDEGEYYWKVRAYNTQNGTISSYSSQRSIIVDTTPPTKPILQKPLNNSVDTNSVDLIWSHAADAYGDSIFVASDSLFANIVYKTGVINANNYTLNPLPSGVTYYWKITSIDKAGNVSPSSAGYKFYLSL